MTQTTVTLAIEGDTAFVTLSGPRSRNAVSRSFHHELGRCLGEIRGREDVRFVVLSGAGGVFSSGGDLRELSDGLPADYVDDYWERMRATIVALGEMEQVVVSVIEGAAVGAGASLALAADIVLAEATARLQLSFVHIGYVPDAGATWLLPRSAGYAVARDLLLTGRPMGVPEALRCGLVSRVFEPGDADSTLSALLEELRRAPRSALALTKSLINGQERDAMVEAIRAEGAMQPVAASLSDTASLIAGVLARSTGTNGSSAPPPHRENGSRPRTSQDT